MKKIIPLILAGGKGSRFWPLSREHFPKQFLSIDGGESLLQKTMLRAKGIACGGVPYIIAQEGQCILIEHSLKEKAGQEYCFIGEPFSRNTAIAIYHGCRYIKEKEDDAIVVVMPSDHFIGNESQFFEDIRAASNVASEMRSIVLLGIKPTYPEVGFGYAEVGNPYCCDCFQCYPIRDFTEKPNRELAEIYLEKGNFYWNSGIFVFDLNVMEQAYERHFKSLVDEYERDISVESIYSNVAPISFDKAILEKESELLLYESSFEWNDLGSYVGLSSLISEDENGNICNGNHILYGVNDSVIMTKNSLTMMVGVSDLIVAEDNGVLLICHKKLSSDVGKYVSELSGKNRIYR